MAKGKYLKKPGKYLRKPGKYLSTPEISRTSPKFKMNRQTKQQIKAWAAAALILGGIQSTKVEASAQEIPVEFVGDAVSTYSICVPNDSAKITVDGKNYKIDENSFIILSDEEALAYDEYGNILKGQISSSDYKVIKTMTESEMSRYDIYQVNSQSGANVRSTAEITDDNVISGVLNGDYILVDTEAVSGNSNEHLSMFVDTSTADYVPLKLRSTPKSGNTENIITSIPHGSSVQILTNAPASDNPNWVFVSYKSSSGVKSEGWVSKNYLSQELSSENIHTNATGNVTGIDVSGMDASTLRTVLQNGLPQSVQKNTTTYDTSKFAGDINFVFMKLGSSSYLKGDLQISNYSAYDEKVALCEELGVPYGFYYYSTAITEKEAQQELATIKNRIEALREKYDMNCNQLEIVVDFELNNDRDRQYKGNIAEQTKAKATLINGIQELGLSDNVLIYGPGRCMQHTQADQIIDLEQLHSLLNNPEQVRIWLCSHIYSNGNSNKNLEKDIAYAEERGFSTVVTQTVLDIAVKNAHIDIDNMDLEHFNMLTQNQKTNNDISHSNDKKWFFTLTVRDGNIYEGYMREDVIQTIDSFEEVNERIEENMQNLMFVRTSDVRQSPLNLRLTPETSSEDNLVTKIPYGSLVQLLGATQEYDNKKWVSIKYVTPDGNTFEGWVDDSWLSSEMPTLKTNDTEKNDVTVNANDTEKNDATVRTNDTTVRTNSTGNVTGIDVSGMNASTLRKVLQGELPESFQKVVNNQRITYDTSELAGDINYVFMKIGGSSYKKGDLSISPYKEANYAPKVEVCEELGVPYGFYYYSTAITVEEAEKELETIKERIESLREKYDLNYNQLEIIVDVELPDASKTPNARQYKGNIQEQTQAKAHLINGIQELELSKNVLIYGPCRCMNPASSDQIINLKLLHSMLNDPENVNIWLCSHMRSNGDYSKSFKDDIAFIEEQGFSVVATQLLLDVSLHGELIDVDNMNLEHFNMLTQNQKTNDDISYSSYINNTDDER